MCQLGGTFCTCLWALVLCVQVHNQPVLREEWSYARDVVTGVCLWLQLLPRYTHMLLVASDTVYLYTLL